MRSTPGVIAALTAPIFEAVGFLEWDIHWSKGGGSAFALNLYKCTISAFAFFFMVSHANNNIYLQYILNWGNGSNSPPSRYSYEYEHNMQHRPHFNGVHMRQEANQMMANNMFDEQPIDSTQQQQKQQKQQQQQQQQLQHHHQQQQNQQQQSPATRRLLIHEMPQIDSFMSSDQQHEYNVPLQHDGFINQSYITYNTNIGRRAQETINAQYYQPNIELPDSYVHPFQGHTSQIPKLVLSSFLGIIIGDCAELEALRLVGARRVLVVSSIKPLAAAILGNLLLGETLYLPAIIGMLLSVYGIYLVLVSSLEDLEKAKDKQKRASIKRLNSFGSNSPPPPTNESRSMICRKSSANYMDDKDADDQEVALINEGMEVGKVKLIGMRRRPLSRHDISADYEEAFGEAEEETDALMMLLEDGRGIIDTTICCGGDRDGLRMRKSSGSSGSESRSGSWGNQSWGEMGMHHEHDLDIMNRMDDFDDEDGDLGFFFGTDDPPSPPQYGQMTTAVHEAMERDQVVSISLPLPKEKKIRSSLRQSRFGQNASSNKAEGRNKDLVKETSLSKNNHASISTTPIDNYVTKASSDSASSSSTPIKQNTNTSVTADGFSQKRKISRRGSSNSIISTGSECGPPIGMYHGNKKETHIQRLVRLRTGYVLATVNVLLDAYGAILIKRHGVGLSTWEINFCRMGFAGLFMIFISGFMRVLEHKNQSRQESQNLMTNDTVPPSKKVYNERIIAKWYRLPQLSVVSWMTVSIGVFFVTFLCPALTNYALFEIPLALAISLTATTPLYTMPLGFIMKGEIPSRKSLIGALFSVSGVVVLCLWGIDGD